MKNLPVIVCAAMLMKDEFIVTGIRHYSPEMRVVMDKIYGKGYHLKVETQGFVDQYGKFYDREEAWVIARKMGQIRRKTGVKEFRHYETEELKVNSILFSENLY
jgi:hypothetical protein